jgi:hypothetical protein
VAAEDRVRCGGTVRELPPPVPVTARFDGYQTSNMRTGSGEGGRLSGRQLGVTACPAQGRRLRICVRASGVRGKMLDPRPPRCPRHRPGPAGRHRKGQVKQASRYGARSRCRVRESLKTVADGGIVSSDPPAEDRDDFRRQRPGATARDRRVFFPSGFPIHVVDFGPLHPFTVILTAGGEASAAAAQPRFGAAGGAAAS